RLCVCLLALSSYPRHLHSFPTRRSSDLIDRLEAAQASGRAQPVAEAAEELTRRGHVLEIGSPAAADERGLGERGVRSEAAEDGRSEEHTSELQSPCNLVCRLLLEKKKKK